MRAKHESDTATPLVPSLQRSKIPSPCIADALSSPSVQISGMRICCKYSTAFRFAQFQQLFFVLKQKISPNYWTARNICNFCQMLWLDNAGFFVDPVRRNSKIKNMKLTIIIDTFKFHVWARMSEDRMYGRQ